MQCWETGQTMLKDFFQHYYIRVGLHRNQNQSSGFGSKALSCNGKVTKNIYTYRFCYSCTRSLSLSLSISPSLSLSVVHIHTWTCWHFSQFNLTQSPFVLVLCRRRFWSAPLWSAGSFLLLPTSSRDFQRHGQLRILFPEAGIEHC